MRSNSIYLVGPHPNPFPDGEGRNAGGFTLVELLVVIGIISLLAAILLPALNRAREAAQAAVCASNIRQLHLASMGYAAENDGFWPPAHFDYVTVATNLHRWHGTRQSTADAFDMNGSPLKSFLQTKAVRQCPVFEPAHAGFEASAGGYGYNNHYIGSSIGVLVGQPHADNLPAKLGQVRKPAETIAFTDAAMGDPRLIEYSFAEPPIAHTQWGSFDNSPSIQFRHRGRASICWADGHVSAEPMAWTRPTNAYGAINAALHLGFVGPQDNSLYDRQ